MSQERTTIDDAVTNLTHIYILGAQYLLDVMTKAVKQYRLEADLTPEMKRKIKDDLGFSSKAVYCLGEASRAYKTMSRNLQILEEELNSKLFVKTDYDKQVANMYDILSTDLVYLTLSEGNPEREASIQKHLASYDWPDDLAAAYKQLRLRRQQLLHK